MYNKIIKELEKEKKDLMDSCSEIEDEAAALSRKRQDQQGDVYTSRDIPGHYGIPKPTIQD